MPYHTAEDSSFLFRNFAEVEFFKQFVQDNQNKIISDTIRKLQIRAFPKHTPIFFKGDRSDKFYIVAKGTVKIMIPDRSKEKKTCWDPEFERAFCQDPRFFE